MSVHFHQGDLDRSVTFEHRVAVDTETLGLSLVRDALCVVQLSAGDGHAHVVKLDRNSYNCPHLKSVLSDPNLEKIFHYARFDIAMIKRDLKINVAPVFCTKIASKLVRTYTDRHGLKDVAREVAGVELSKQQQSSDWGAESLTDAQLEYAASDVLYLHKIREGLAQMLEREGRMELAQSCFKFLSTRAMLDLLGWDETDIFAHS